MFSQFQETLVAKEDFGTDGRIILKRIIKQHCGRMGAGFVRCRITYSGGIL
jgi:hypothetical protein